MEARARHKDPSLVVAVEFNTLEEIARSRTIHVCKNLARMEEHVTPLETRCAFVFVNLNSLEEVAKK